MVLLRGARANVYGRRWVAEHSHLVEFPEALEVLFSRVGELKVVLGPAAGPGLDQMEARLREGLAARGRGDVGAAVMKIGQAMDLLAGLAAHADPTEAAMMRAVAAQFKQAIARGAIGEARGQADVMRERSGSVLRPKKPR